MTTPALGARRLTTSPCPAPSSMLARRARSSSARASRARVSASKRSSFEADALGDHFVLAPEIFFGRACARGRLLQRRARGRCVGALHREEDFACCDALSGTHQHRGHAARGRCAEARQRLGPERNPAGNRSIRSARNRAAHRLDRQKLETGVRERNAAVHEPRRLALLRAFAAAGQCSEDCAQHA